GSGSHFEESQHGGAAPVICFQVERNRQARTARGQRETPVRLIEIAGSGEFIHLFFREWAEPERHSARADSGQQIESVLRRQNQDQVFRRFFERLEQRIGGLLPGAVNVIDQKYASIATQWFERRAVLQRAHLRD